MRKAEHSRTHNDSRSGGQLPKDRSTANKRQFEAQNRTRYIFFFTSSSLNIKVASGVIDFVLEGQQSAMEIVLLLVQLSVASDFKSLSS